MKTTLIKTLVALMAVAVVSCGEPDKKAELEKLKKEMADLSGKIKDLEKELNTSDAPVGTAVQVMKLQKTSFSHYIEIQGAVKSDENLMLSSQSSGQVTKVYVKAGMAVSKGQLLAQTDPDMIVKGMDEVKKQLELATTVYEKQKSLWDQKIGTELQYLQAKNNKEALEKRLASLQEQLDLTRVVSPIAGYVDEVFVNAGEVVMPGMPVARVVNATNYRLVAEVPESYVAKVKQGDALKIYFPDLKKEIDSYVMVIGGVINAVNRTFTIEARLSQMGSAIKPNMIAYLKIKDYTNPSVITVPINTVQSDEKGKYVFVTKTDGKQQTATKVYVTTGISYGSVIEVTDGLKENDVIVTVGHLDLIEGQKVLPAVSK